MSIWSKILIWLVFVATLPFFYLAVRTMKTQAVWRKDVPQFKDMIEKIEDTGLGTPESPGSKQLTFDIQKLHTQLYAALVDRGRLWANCAVKNVDPQGTATVTIDVLAVAALPAPVAPVVDPAAAAAAAVPADPNAPAPAAPAAPAVQVATSGLKAKMVVFAFDQPADFTGDPTATIIKNYLGEFKITGVTAANDKEDVALEATRPLQQWEMDKLAGAGRSWTLYEVMPIDHHDLFAGKDQAEIQTLIKAGTVQEYIRDGQDANDTDAVEVVGVEVQFKVDYEQAKQDHGAELAKLGMTREYTKQPDVAGPVDPNNPAANVQKVESGATLIVANQTAIFDKPTADELVKLGIAEQTGKKFVRTLRDYLKAFHMMYAFLQKCRADLSVTQKNVALLAAAKVETDKSIAARTTEEAKLDAELQESIAERDLTALYLKASEARLASIQAYIAQLESANKQLAARWAAAQAEEARRSQPATTNPRAAVP